MTTVMQSAKREAAKLGRPVYVTTRTRSSRRKRREEYLITDTEPAEWLYRVHPSGAVDRAPA